MFFVHARLFFNDPATTEIYTLSLHDALPICRQRDQAPPEGRSGRDHLRPRHPGHRHAVDVAVADDRRSEEHTSELQSQSNLVCRLLLEKKKKPTTPLNSSNSRSRHVPAL